MAQPIARFRSKLGGSLTRQIESVYLIAWRNKVIDEVMSGESQGISLPNLLQSNTKRVQGRFGSIRDDVNGGRQNLAR